MTLAQRVSEKVLENRARAIDMVYNEIDTLLLESKFEEADQAIDEFFPYIGLLPKSIFYSIIIISNPFKQFLPKRNMLYSTLKVYFEDTNDESGLEFIKNMGKNNDTKNN